MARPYFKQLESLEGQKVTIDRDGAPDVSGEIEFDDDDIEDGVHVLIGTKEVEYPENVFIRYENIRGIRHKVFRPL